MIFWTIIYHDNLLPRCSTFGRTNGHHFCSSVSNIHTGHKWDTRWWPQEIRYDLELVTTPSTVWISRMRPGLRALPVLFVLCRLPFCDSGSLKWSVETRTDDNRQSNQSGLGGLTGWPQQCLSIMRHHGLSEEKKGKRRMELPEGEVANKNTRAGKIESRKMKSRQDTEGGEAGWKIGRCTTGWWNRARKTERESGGTAAQTILKKHRNKKRRHTKGKEDKSSRGQGGTGRDGGSPQDKKKCQTQFFSQKRGELKRRKKGSLLSVSV